MPAAAKKLQDHKPKIGSAETTYTHTFSDGQTITLPLMDYLPFGIARKVRNLPETEQMFVLIEEVCDEAALAVVDAQHQADIGDLFSDWLEASGIDLGESESSAS